MRIRIQKEVKRLMKKMMVKDILKLHASISEKKGEVALIWKLRDRLMSEEMIFCANTFAYHVMPVKYLDTVFSEYDEELREQTEWISDRRFGRNAWTKFWEEEDGAKERFRKWAADEGYTVPDDVLTRKCRGEEVYGELPIARHCKAVLHCDRIFDTKDGKWVLKLSDPYGTFVSQPFDISMDEARTYIKKMVCVDLYTEYLEEFDVMDMATCLHEALENDDRKKPLFKRCRPILKEYERHTYRELKISNVKILPYALNMKIGKERIGISPLLSYVKSFENADTEEKVIAALDTIEKYVAKSDECTFNCRFSPTDYRIILKNRTLYQFFWCNDMFCFSKEKDARFPTERETRPAFGDGILLEKAYRFMFRDFAEVFFRIKCQEFDEANTRWLVGNEPERLMKPWDEYEPLESGRDLRRKCKSELKKIREEAIKEEERIRLRYCDRWEYTKAATLLHESKDIYNTEYNMSCILCEHPEYYEKWKGTIFDQKGAGVIYRSILFDEESRRNEEGYIKKVGRQLAWHEYHLKNGAKSPFEDLEIFDIESLIRKSQYDLDADICVKYVGYCDSASMIDGEATVHLVDPSGDVYFRGIDITTEQLQKAIGSMCAISCLYNYYEEGRYRMLEFEILPFSLNERTGKYPEDTIRIKKNLVVKGRRL